jgi:hypothetical protein
LTGIIVKLAERSAVTVDLNQGRIISVVQALLADIHGEGLKRVGTGSTAENTATYPRNYRLRPKLEVHTTQKTATKEPPRER